MVELREDVPCSAGSREVGREVGRPPPVRLPALDPVGVALEINTSARSLFPLPATLLSPGEPRSGLRTYPAWRGASTTATRDGSFAWTPQCH